MPNASELEWGWKKESIEAPALWGARMYVESWEARIAQTNPRAKGPRLVTKRQLAILPDRMHMLGEGTPRHELERALDGGILDELRELAKRGSLDGPDRTFTLYQPQYGEGPKAKGHVETHVRIAGGYVYVTCAWRGP